MGTIISGKYNGHLIYKADNSNLAYLRVGAEYVFFTKDLVESITVKNTTNDVDKATVAKGAFTAGATGAIIASASEATVYSEVRWKTGEVSLVKSDASIYEAMMVGMYQSRTNQELNDLGKEDTAQKEKDDNTDTWIKFGILVAWIACYMFGQM